MNIINKLLKLEFKVKKMFHPDPVQFFKNYDHEMILMNNSELVNGGMMRTLLRVTALSINSI